MTIRSSDSSQDGKERAFAKIHERLNPGGATLVYDLVSRAGETREDYISHLHADIDRAWTRIPEDQRASIRDHVRDNDYPLDFARNRMCAWQRHRRLVPASPRKTAPLLTGIAFIVALLAVVAFSVHARELVVSTSIWPPYVDPKLPGQGLALSIVTAAFQRAGYEPRIEIHDWERTLGGVRSGEYGIVAAAWRSPDRIRDFEFSDPYLANQLKFLKRHGTTIEFETLEDLNGLRVGVVYEYVYEQEFDEATGFVKAPETHIVPNVMQLLEGNIDLTVDDERTLRYEISRHFGEHRHELEFLPKPLALRDLHVAVSRTHPDHETLVRDFNRGLAEIRRDGTYRKLLRKANEEIWKQSYLPKSARSGKDAGDEPHH
ncbi:MAG: transporter substrate-binding domain-containing protein [Pseudomonadota bacterium]|nr:transporter substrate-binding domain-containing protein [Pseudomonadota bacterium]